MVNDNGITVSIVIKDCADKILPYIIYVGIFGGILVCLYGIMEAIYTYIIKKPKEDFGKRLFYTMLQGVGMIVAAIMVNFLAKYEIHFSYNNTIPSICIVLLICFLLLRNKNWEK